jgi:uncharacterized membrane protein YsdA (DUF1294 family)
MSALALGIAAWVAAASLVTFALYGIDKRAARRGGRRVPEATLQLGALVGGSPGAFAGQRAFRHKTKKLSFQLVFWAIVLLQAGLLAAWWSGMLGGSDG